MIPSAVDIADGQSVSTTHQTSPTVPGFEIIGVAPDMWEYSMRSEGIIHEYSKEYSIPMDTALLILHSLAEPQLHI